MGRKMDQGRMGGCVLKYPQIRQLARRWPEYGSVFDKRLGTVMLRQLRRRPQRHILCDYYQRRLLLARIVRGTGQIAWHWSYIKSPCTAQVWLTNPNKAKSISPIAFKYAKIKLVTPEMYLPQCEKLDTNQMIFSMAAGNYMVNQNTMISSFPPCDSAWRWIKSWIYHL